MPQYKLDSKVVCIQLVDRVLPVVEQYKINRKVGAIGRVENFFTATQLNYEKGVYHIIVDGKLTAFWADELKQLKYNLPVSNDV